MVDNGLRATFLVCHRATDAGELRRALTDLGKSRPELLDESPSLRGLDRTRLLYATERFEFRLFAFAESGSELLVYVEPVRGTVFDVAGRAWSRLRTALKRLRPQLDRAYVSDVLTGTDLPLHGRCTTLGTELRRREALVPVLVSVAAVLYFVVGARLFPGVASGAAQGAVSAAITLLVVVLVAAREVYRAPIRWDHQEGRP